MKWLFFLIIMILVNSCNNQLCCGPSYDPGTLDFGPLEEMSCIQGISCPKSYTKALELPFEIEVFLLVNGSGNYDDNLYGYQQSRRVVNVTIQTGSLNVGEICLALAYGSSCTGILKITVQETSTNLVSYVGTTCCGTFTTLYGSLTTPGITSSHVVQTTAISTPTPTSTKPSSTEPPTTESSPTEKLVYILLIACLVSGAVLFTCTCVCIVAVSAGVWTYCHQKGRWSCWSKEEANKETQLSEIEASVENTMKGPQQSHTEDGPSHLVDGGINFDCRPDDQ